MAQREQDREDLLREATALVQRVELRVEGFAEPVIVGFRRGGEASVFFGGDQVYQFNARNQLRRAFVDGRMLKAEDGRMVQLEKRRTEHQVQLVRREFDAEQTAALLVKLREDLSRLGAQLDAQFFQVVGEVPSGGDVVSLVRQWLAVLPPQIAVAQEPNVA
jgi:hypothetical protein